MNALFGKSRVAVALLTLDTTCLWYYIAGGRLGGSLLLLAGLASLGLLPSYYSARVLARNKLMVVAALILSTLTYAESLSFGKSAVATLFVLVVFALGCGAVSGFLATVLARRQWVFLAVVALVVALAGWAATFATVIMPQNKIVTGESGNTPDEVERMFGVFFVGNNYYSLTYYLTVPIATVILVFGEGVTCESLVLLLAGLVTIFIALMFGRRGPVLVGAITWLVVIICARRPGRSVLRTVFLAASLLVCAAGMLAWLQSREWGLNVIENYKIRSEDIPTDDRFGLWRSSVQCIIEHPDGGGRAFFQGVSTYAHNAVLDVGLDLGIVGLLVFAIFLGQITWRAVARMLRRGQSLDRLDICLFAILLSNLLSLQQEPFVSERMVVVLWAGVTLSCVSKAGAKLPVKRMQPFIPRNFDAKNMP